MKSFFNQLPIFLIHIYRHTLSYFVGGNCRFYPSCSEYGLECYQRHSFFKATGLVAKRLSKCHPLSGKQGYDPVPPHSDLCCKGK